MNRKETKTKQTDSKNVNRKTVVNDVDSSRLTTHDSRSLNVSQSFIHILCIVFLILIIYSNTLNAPFQWDEGYFLVDNPIIKDLHYFTNPSDAKGFELYSGFINRYVGYLTFALNYRIHGLSVTGYHIVNIAIHIANSILVYFLVLLTFRTTYFKGQGSRVKGQESKAGSQSLKSEYQSLAPCPLPLDPKLVAFFSAAIFAVHPLQTEAVTYVFQRFASLVTFFYLLSLVFYIKARIGNNVLPFSRFTFLLISIISAVLAMKTKENAFTLPIVIALYEFCFFSRLTSHVSRSFSRFLYLVPILLTLSIIPLTLMSLSGAHQIDPGAYGFNVFLRWEYLFTQFRVIVTYLRLLFFPVGQNIDYDYHLIESFFTAQVLLSFVFLFLLFGLGVYLVIKTKDNIKENDSGLSGIVSRFTSHVSQPLTDSRHFRLMGFGILWFFITLSVESSIIPLPMLINEYRMYLPSIGMIICVVTGVFWFFPRFTSHVSRFTFLKRFTFHVSRFTVVTLALIMGVLAIATYQRNEVWGDEIRLWKDTAEKSPAKARVHYSLGYAYKEHNMPDKAAEQYLIAIKLKPDWADAHNSLGTTYQTLNIRDKAIEQYLIAIRLNPDYAKAYNNLGTIYKDSNMPDKAIEQYLIALKLKPDWAEAHYNLGVIYQSRNMTDEATEQYLIALKLKPDLLEAHSSLGSIYLTRNMPDKAIEQYLTALKLKPDWAGAYFNLGVIYQSLNMPDKAMEQYILAVKLKPDFVQARNNLGFIYQSLNMPDRAIPELQAAIDLRPNEPEAYFNLGLVYYKMGQMDKARQELTAGLKIRPDNQEAQELLKTVIK